MKNYTMLELAFIGDAVHTLFIREQIVKKQDLKMNDTHKLASRYCSAKKQSSVLDRLLPSLNNEETEIARMARNSKTKHIAKNADPADYHKATSFEALIGWLFVNNKKERLDEILEISIMEE